MRVLFRVPEVLNRLPAEVTYIFVERRGGISLARFGWVRYQTDGLVGCRVWSLAPVSSLFLSPFPHPFSIVASARATDLGQMLWSPISRTCDFEKIFFFSLMLNRCHGNENLRYKCWQKWNIMLSYGVRGYPSDRKLTVQLFSPKNNTLRPQSLRHNFGQIRKTHRYLSF